MARLSSKQGLACLVLVRRGGLLGMVVFRLVEGVAACRETSRRVPASSEQGRARRLDGVSEFVVLDEVLCWWEVRITTNRSTVGSL